MYYETYVESNKIVPLFICLLTFRTGCVCCSFQDNAPEAAVGERLSLLCSLGSRCDSSYRWTQVTSNETLEERGADLVLSENLTSVDEVEGKLYRCECTDDDNDDCLLFRIVGTCMVGVMCMYVVYYTNTAI